MKNIQVKLVPSPTKNKKWRMIFLRKNNIFEYTDFGQKNPIQSDYTIHNDPVRKSLFLNRFARLIKEKKDDPSSAMTLSRMILWNRPTIEESLKDYKKKYNLE